ncbi:Holliday junction resolvase RuvX [Helicobacter kayseriensis]|uniref:Holliday junction resolvase RuvX n=1 Tax=Helicobacter kayseriensis TaxID=2905877 RepID=UPI001E3C6D23|nr:Holliday junction resolvase RuvX [Helicobacter kayseriensis]MCE3047213.1 Holliday junction resolvase RuvX [Helicobacter kayseriensis]MCE3048584.1 Holliday junction resolvase RuvX [Helicobacter kayseriensis]
MSDNNILACDIGLKRIGLASHIQGITLPLPPILRKNRDQAALALSQLLKDRAINILIVGMPESDEHKPHEMERRIKHFVSLVEFSGTIIYVNEALSSKIAQESLFELSKKERKEKIKNGELDSLSAMEILERYLSKQ